MVVYLSNKYTEKELRSQKKNPTFVWGGISHSIII